MPDKPLANLRVLDLGTFLAAPFCGTLLAEFGAEVIKIEIPGIGDSLRTLGEERVWHCAVLAARVAQQIRGDLRLARP